MLNQAQSSVDLDLASPSMEYMGLHCTEVRSTIRSTGFPRMRCLIVDYDNMQNHKSHFVGMRDLVTLRIGSKCRVSAVSAAYINLDS